MSCTLEALQSNRPDGAPEATASGAAQAWHAIWTRSHFEQVVADQLRAKGFELFLPTIAVWSRRGGKRHLIEEPMFGGYLFLHHAVDKYSYIEVQKARGVVRLLGERWDRLAVIPEAEIESLKTALCADTTLVPYPYPQEGQRVRIMAGPLADIEGVLIQRNLRKGLLVLSVNLLRRSVAVEVDCTLVAAA